MRAGARVCVYVLQISVAFVCSVLPPLPTGELQQQQQQFHSNGRLGAGEAVPPSGAEEELPRIEEPGGATEALSPVQQALRRSIFGEFKVRRTLNFDMQNPAKSSESDDPVSPRGKEEAHSVGTYPDTNTGPAGSPKLSSRNSSNRRRPPPPPPPMSAESVLSSEPGTENRVPLMVPLEPAEHQWLVQCAAGRWNHVLGLLMQDSQMATKRDFTSGFTVLHWAAKCGDSRMLVTVLDLARQAGVDVNVDARSHGGYTPLHVAALHGQDYIVTILVAECGANVGARDNSGRRAYHYLRPGAAASLREMLGQPRVPQQERVQKQHREEPELLPLEPSRGRLHSISRLFQPHTAEHKRKHKQRPSISSSIFTFHSEDAALSPTEEKEEEEQLH